MKKIDEIADSTSTLNRAEEQEPIFILRANDEFASSVVRTWAIMYYKHKSAEPMGLTPTQRTKYEEAMTLATAMDEWLRLRGGATREKAHVHMTHSHAYAMSSEDDRPLNADRVIERLCRVQERLFEALGSVETADCFCREGGYWGVNGYDGTYERGYRNDGVALRFIEDAVTEKLQRMQVAQDANRRGKPQGEA